MSTVTRFSVAEEFPRMCARFVPRAASSEERVVGPIQSRGACMEPLICNGDLMYFDATATPADGDIISFEWPPEKVERYVNSERGRRFIEKWGPVTDYGVKFFVRFAGADWIVCNRSISRIAGERVIGVLCRIQRPSVTEVV